MNKVVLVGRLTKDPELRYTQSNIAAATFTLAVNRNYKNANGGYDADFIPVVVWRGLAEMLSKRLKKGSRVCISGRIQTRSYDGNDGQKRYVTEVVANEVFFAESKRNSDSTYTSPSPFTQPAAETYSQNTSSFEQPSSTEAYTSVDFAGDDDLPF